MAIGGHDIISMNRTSHCTKGEVHFLFWIPVVLNVYTAHCPLSSNKNRQASSCSLRCWTPGASQQEMWDAPSSGCHRGGGKCVGETWDQTWRIRDHPHHRDDIACHVICHLEGVFFGQSPQAVAAYLLRRSADISSLSKRKAEHHKVWIRGTPKGLWFSIWFPGMRDALRGTQVYIEFQKFSNQVAFFAMFSTWLSTTFLAFKPSESHQIVF